MNDQQMTPEQVADFLMRTTTKQQLAKKAAGLAEMVHQLEQSKKSLEARLADLVKREAELECALQSAIDWCGMIDINTGRIKARADRLLT